MKRGLGYANRSSNGKRKACSISATFFFRGSPQAIALKLALLETGLSRATLLKYINNLNSYFEQEKVNCRIVYYKDKLFLEEDYNLSNQEVLKALMKDSIKYTILISLFNQRQFTIVGLSQELMVSEATLNRHLAHLNELLAEFDIAISQGKQIGDELQWRYFYYELFKQLWSYDKCQNMIKKLDLDSLILLIERLAQHTLTRELSKIWGFGLVFVIIVSLLWKKYLIISSPLWNIINVMLFING